METIKNKGVIFVFLLLMIGSNVVMCQNERVISDFPKYAFDSLGYDEFKRKQGNWIVKMDDIVVYYPDSAQVIKNVYGSGFYVDNHRVGFWDIRSVSEDKQKKLIAQIFYEADTALFKISYHNNMIMTIVFEEEERQRDQSTVEKTYCKDKIIFNDQGKVVERTSYLHDGRADTYNYIK